MFRHAVLHGCPGQEAPEKERPGAGSWFHALRGASTSTSSSGIASVSSKFREREGRSVLRHRSCDRINIPLGRLIVMVQVRKVGHLTNRLLAALSPEDLAWLEPQLDVVDLQRGQILYDTGETIRHAYFPHDTVVSLLTVLEDGGSVEMAVFGREAVIGLSSALFSRRSFGRYLVQLNGTASRLSVERLHEMFNTRPRVRTLFLRFTEALVRQAFQNVACNAVHSVEARCCRRILSTQDRVDQDALPLTHEILSEMLGVQRSSVSVVTRSLQNAGLIVQRRGVIVITDRARLEDAACECYRRIKQSYEDLLPVPFDPGGS
jgi:CRP-like cAMP-binding protein